MVAAQIRRSMEGSSAAVWFLWMILVVGPVFRVLSNLEGPYFCPFTSSMAASSAADGPQGPSPKLPKLSDNNGSVLATSVGGENPCGLSFLKVKKLSANAILPTRSSSLAAGYDLSSAIEAKVPARGKALIPTDLSIAIPEGTYARIAPRSGLAWKKSIDVGAGVVDADYRGPLGVVLFNHSDVDFDVKLGDQIAQLIIERIITPAVVEVDDLDLTVRGSGGFGSTGVGKV